MPKKRVAIRNHQAEAALFSRRAVVTLGIVFVVFLVLLNNLYTLQVKLSRIFNASTNRIMVLPVPNRWLNLDPTVVLLLKNIPVLHLEVYPQSSRLAGDLKLQTILELDANVVDDFYQRLRQARRFPQVTFAEQLRGKTKSLDPHPFSIESRY